MALTTVAASILLLQGGAIQHPLLADAYRSAQKENKVVFIKFGASWCGPCRRLEAVLDRPDVQPIWKRNFVTVKVVVDESGDKVKLNSPGGNELRKRLGGDGQGIPYFAFLKPDGKLLGTSMMSTKQNMGCPMTPEEIAEFMGALAKVRPGIPRAELQTIKQAFENAG